MISINEEDGRICNNCKDKEAATFTIMINNTSIVLCEECLGVLRAAIFKATK